MGDGALLYILIKSFLYYAAREASVRTNGDARLYFLLACFSAVTPGAVVSREVR